MERLGLTMIVLWLTAGAFAGERTAGPELGPPATLRNGEVVWLTESRDLWHSPYGRRQSDGAVRLAETVSRYEVNPRTGDVAWLTFAGEVGRSFGSVRNGSLIKDARGLRMLDDGSILVEIHRDGGRAFYRYSPADDPRRPPRPIDCVVMGPDGRASPDRTGYADARAQ